MRGKRQNNLHSKKTGDSGGFETTLSLLRQQSSQRPTTSTYGEDSVSADRRRVKRIKVNVPPPPPLKERLDLPLPELPEANFDNVPDMQWEDNIALEDEIDEEEDELEDGVRKARRYAASVCHSIA